MIWPVTRKTSATFVTSQENNSKNRANRLFNTLRKNTSCGTTSFTFTLYKRSPPLTTQVLSTTFLPDTTDPMNKSMSNGPLQEMLLSLIVLKSSNNWLRKFKDRMPNLDKTFLRLTKRLTSLTKSPPITWLDTFIYQSLYASYHSFI